MKAITYTAARQNLAKTMENVCKDHAPIIITRKTTNSVVIMALEDYEALEETAYLLRSPKNTRRLIESIAQIEEGQGSACKQKDQAEMKRKKAHSPDRSRTSKRGKAPFFHKA